MARPVSIDAIAMARATVSNAWVRRPCVGGAVEVNERLSLVLLLMSGPVQVRGSVAARWPGPTPDRWVVGVEFDAVPADAADAIVEWCFQHPFGPDFGLSPEEAQEHAQAAVAAAGQLRVALAQSAAAEETPEPDGPATADPERD
jgi:hypothetical protein